MDSLETDRDAVCVMTYSHDGFGMGHLRRNTSIAARLVQDMPGSSVLMLIGCPSGAVFPLPAGVDYIKIPSIVKVGTEVWQPRSLRISLQKTRTIRASVIQEAADTFRPDVFLVDHIPTGVWGELLPTLQMLREREEPPHIVLGIRDILDSPEVTRNAWRQKKFYEVIDRYYSEVFVYGCQDVFDTAWQYGLAAEVAEKVRYCGYVCSEEPYRTKEQVREELQLRKDNLIVVTAGGGYDAFPMMRACTEAFQFIGEPLPFEAVFITGPLMEAAERERLRTQAKGLDVQVLRCVEDSLSYINAADLVVTMAGYNSLCEVLCLQKKALVVPRPGPSAEQEMRAKLFAERGLVDVLYHQELSPKNLAERLMVDLARTDYPLFDYTLCENGASRAAGRLLELARQIHVR